MVLVLALAGMTGWSMAQPAAQPPNPALPPLPQKGPRPLAGPDSVPAFVDNLTGNDAAFEIIVGQGRILSTKVDIAVAGKEPALLAVGNPAVADFAVVGPRQIRVTGKRIGITDLVIGGGVQKPSRRHLSTVAANHGIAVIHGALRGKDPQVYARQELVPQRKFSALGPVVSQS